MSLPGLSRSFSEVSMPCWSKRRRANSMEVMMWSRSYLAWFTANTTPGEMSESVTKPSDGSAASTSCPSRFGANMCM